MNIILEILSKAIRQEKEIDGILIKWEKIELFLFADDILFCTEKTKASKTIGRTNKFSCKNHHTKYFAFLYTNINYQKEKLRGQFHSEYQKIVIIKYLKIIVTKKVKNLYIENYKTLMKEIEDK